jgi:hypothetical protein
MLCELFLGRFLVPKDRPVTLIHVDIKRLFSIASVLLINVAIAGGVLEIALRVQQTLGPLYDLAVAPETTWIGLSDEFNHVPEPGPDVDANGLHKLDGPNVDACAPKILFMGDSFMQGLGRTDSVSYHVRRYFREKLGRDLCVFNAGQSSYSPSVFVPQAKRLIPLLKPDLVVVDVDETDLWDDYWRYRELVVRDRNGSITAVRVTPINLQFHQGLVASTRGPLYVERLVSKLYFTRIAFPKMLDEYLKQRPADGFWISRLPRERATAEHSAEIAYFTAGLEDLAQTVIARLSKPDQLIYLHHPHLEHLQTSGEVFNDVVASTVRGVAARHGASFYDATATLKVRFGNRPGDYYFPNDMHFNRLGLRHYGTAVAEYLAGTILH